MTRRPGFYLFRSKDRYIDELLEAQERQLQELQKEPEKVGEPKRVEIPKEQLTPGETRGVLLGALLAGLVIGVVFLGIMLVFLLFCVNVWFA